MTSLRRYRLLVCLVTVLLLDAARSAKPPTDRNLMEEGSNLLEDFYSRYNATNQVDLVFVLDRSGSVPLAGWHSMLEFVGKILEHFTVDKDNTRVAVITFSTTASVDIDDLDDADDGRRSEKANKCTLHARLRDKVETRIPFGYTATDDALRKAYQVLVNSRPNAKKAVLILTDGKSNIGPPPVRTAFDILSLRWNPTWDVRSLGPQVELYAFGIEKAYVPELRSIASNLPNHVFMIPKFSLFAEFARSLHGGLQEENWIPTEGDQCMPACNSTFAQCMCGSRVGIYACACSPGYEMIAESCTACPLGYYKDNARPEKCRQCPENTTTAGVASVSPFDCHPLAGHQICSPLPDITNGRKFQVTGTRKDEVLNTGVSCDDVRDGNSCHYECDVGFRLSGPPVMICNNTGLWEGEIPRCDPVDCYEVEQTFGLIVGAKIFYVNNHTLYGATAEVTCRSGRVPLPDVTSWLCDQHGQWSIPPNFQCAEVFCPPLSLPQFIVTTPAECATDVQAHGTVCNLTCADGFQLIGQSTKTCSFANRALWIAEEWPRCRDIQPPVIICPDSVEVTVPYFNQNFTRIHRSAYQNPVVTDNSWPPGFSNYTIQGLPPDGVFPVGLTVLRYIATDSAGNSANCTQNIHVIEKIVDIRRCPSDIYKTGRSLEVSWEDPIFLDQENELLPHMCTPSSGSAFSGEGNQVVCYPQQHPGIQCVFTVTVKPKDCPMPNDPPPDRGSLICGENEHLQRVCRIMCEKGYSMKDLSKQQFRCRDDGTWNPELGNWPACAKTGWGRNVLIAQSMHIRYSGRCQDNRATIREAFKATMKHILTSDFGPCTEEHLCSVQNVVVFCGQSRRKRSHFEDNQPWSPTSANRRSKRSEDEGVRVEFSLAVTCDESREVTHDEQKQLLYTLENVMNNVTEMVDAGQLAVEIDGQRHQVDGIETLSEMPEFYLNCSAGEVPVVVTDNVDEMSARCIICPPGTYLDNDDCVLCPNNTYQDEEGQLQCKQCPNNRTTLAPGAWNVSQCKDTCQPGSYSSTGYEPCASCAIGFFQPLEGQTACLPCPSNTTTSDLGASNVNSCQAPCSSGSYSKTGLEPCSACPPGTYQPEEGQTSCLACDYLKPTAEMEEWCPEPRNCSETNTSCVNGFCVMSRSDYIICKCNDGFHGDACELNIDDCTEDSCHNGGTCRDITNGVICECPLAFDGPSCDHYTGPCSAAPCQNNASCVDDGLSFRCICADGYNGTTCEIQVDPCLADRCIHGTCFSQDGQARCECQPGYAGEFCQKLIDYCANVTCYNGGICVGTQTGYHCSCAEGFSGEHCEKLVDHCTPEPCHDHGRCVNTMTSYYCVCYNGYYGNSCSLSADTSFSLSFNDRRFGYVELPIWDVMYNISACLWMRSLDVSRRGTLLSYAAYSNWISTSYSDVFTMYDYNDLEIIVNGEAVQTHMHLNDGYWHHICVVWIGYGGVMRIYINGTISGSALVAKETHLEAPGTLVIGQRQLGELDRYFITRNGFIGDISQVNVYDRVLDENTIRSLADKTTCVKGEGSIMAWTSVLQGVQGDLGISAQCLDVNECLSEDVCEDYEYCVDKVGGYQCEPCPSVGCPGRVVRHDPCDSSPCLNGGTCVTHLGTHRCICPLGFTGDSCDLFVSTCSITTCQNGGTCHEVSGGVFCDCTRAWTGRFCHVMYEAKCSARPCLNGGTCVENSATGQYTCTCPSDGRNYGRNCELVTGCDHTPGPCISGATCVVLEDANITCLCPPDFEGETCFYVPPAITPTTPIDYCLNVQCQNGGTCNNLASGFECSCTIDYKGLYCGKKRKKETRLYDVSVSLDVEYKPSLKQDEVFREKVKQQVHSIYASSLRESTLRVDIVDIRPGSVQVDMIFHHTVYLDSKAPAPKDMEVILYNNLQNKRLGSLPASTDNFKFNYKHDVSTWLVYLLVAVAVVTLFVIIFIPWYVITKKRQEANPEKLNNMPMCEMNRVVNPAFEADSGPPTPQARHIHEDNLYADLDPSPYAVDLCSGGKDTDPEVSKRFPSKRGRDINKDWASWQRKTTPLPPKPGELPAAGDDECGYLTPCKGTPPPSYKDLHQNETQARYGRNNVNVDAEYIAPMSAYEERHGLEPDHYLKPSGAAEKDNISRAKDLHVYINSPADSERTRHDDVQPTYLSLLSTPPATGPTGGDPDQSAPAAKESPDYLRLNPDAKAPRAVMRDVRKKDESPESSGSDSAPGENGDAGDASQDQDKDANEKDDGGESEKRSRNHTAVYAIGGD